MIQEAKLHPPSVTRQWAVRHELVESLAGSRARVVLIEAPAGAGKTVLAAQWRDSPLEGRRFAWVSRDSGDNDRARLWRHLTLALRGASQGRCSRARWMRSRARTPDVAGRLLRVLVDELATIPASIVVVLDDYGVIKDAACHEQVGFLLRHSGDSVQVVLTTRSAPPLPLARLRAAGAVAEVKMPDVRFTAEEAGAVVRAVAGVRLGEPDLAELLERTEGWPAGVSLSVLSLRGRSSPGAFIRQFTGNNRYVADFLIEEALARLPCSVRQFLERTSILGRFTAPLANAVTGAGDAARIIDLLERDNLFLVLLDNERVWFRYQHLFRQMLLGQLSKRPACEMAASYFARVSSSGRLSL